MGKLAGTGLGVGFGVGLAEGSVGLAVGGVGVVVTEPVALAVNMGGGLSSAVAIAMTTCPGGAASGGGGSSPKNANKINHLFDKARHNLDLLVQRFGSREAAYDALETATKQQVSQTSGTFMQQVHVGGYNVTVSGMIVNGNAEIGTAYIQGAYFKP